VADFFCINFYFTLICDPFIGQGKKRNWLAQGQELNMMT